MFIRPNWFVAAKRLRQMPEKEGGAEGAESGRELGGERGASSGQASSSSSICEQELYSPCPVLLMSVNVNPSRPTVNTHAQPSTHTSKPRADILNGNRSRQFSGPWN